jgi:hypothetical protein
MLLFPLGRATLLRGGSEGRTSDDSGQLPDVKGETWRGLRQTAGVASTSRRELTEGCRTCLTDVPDASGGRFTAGGSCTMDDDRDNYVVQQYDYYFDLALGCL